MAWVTIIFGTFGCDSFLDKEYDASLSDEKVFSNSTLTRQFLTDIYTNLPDGIGVYGDPQFLGASRDAMTDNATSYWGLHFYNKINTDSYTSTNHPLLGFWGINFNGIRKCNQFLKNIDPKVIPNETTEGDNNKLYDRYKAEAILLRAIFHFELVAYFGDAPILTEVLDMDNQAQMNLPRQKSYDVLKWVADQCDLVKDVLPFRYASEGNWGRVNGASAYALKSRALLYRASALNNSTNDLNWWQEAAQAAKSLIDKNSSFGNPFSLYPDYQKCFVDPPYQNNEIILSRSIWNTSIIETSLLPEGFAGCSGRTNPTQNLVDSYEMANGKFIYETGSGYNPQNPYVNRDPRFHATIFHHGSVWGRADRSEQRSIDVHFNSASDKGADYRGSLGGTFTGYYLKKYVNPDLVMSDKKPLPHAWVIYRYAEVLLNYAEALNETLSAPNQLVYDAVNLVRHRGIGQMPPLPAGLSKDQMRKRIRNERRVELAFEDHRFFDVRRWKAFEGVTYNNEKNSSNTFFNDKLLFIGGVQVRVAGSLVRYTFGEVTEQGQRVFNSPKNYLFPIPYNETKKAPNLGQNDGWQ